MLSEECTRLKMSITTKEKVTLEQFEWKLKHCHNNNKIISSWATRQVCWTDVVTLFHLMKQSSEWSIYQRIDSTLIIVFWQGESHTLNQRALSNIWLCIFFIRVWTKPHRTRVQYYKNECATTVVPHNTRSVKKWFLPYTNRKWKNDRNLTSLIIRCG